MRVTMRGLAGAKPGEAGVSFGIYRINHDVLRNKLKLPHIIIAVSPRNANRCENAVAMQRDVFDNMTDTHQSVILTNPSVI
jgi:hypothetical protein